MHNQPVIVVVIADTHVNHLEELPPQLLAALTQADLIIHLGDYTSRELLDELRKLGNFYGIAGNHDDPLVHQELKLVEVLEVGGKRLGLIHGMILPFGSLKRMKAWFRRDGLDAILYGHTHLGTSRLVDGVFFFNPGSVAGKFPAYNGSFGFLTLDGTVSGEIIPLEHLVANKRRFLPQFKTILQEGIHWFETWPYVDFLYLTSKISLDLKRSSFILRKRMLRNKAGQ